MCQIDLVHLMSYIVYWYEPSDLAYEISHLIWHMRFTAIWGNRSTVDPIVLPIWPRESPMRAVSVTSVGVPGVGPG